jgi:predicted nucleotidyltransferase component of viral defense system
MLYEHTVSPDLLTVLRQLQHEQLFKDYILAGGTALALQLGHRHSDDIDLFTTKYQDNEICLQYFNNHFENIDIINNNKNILQLKTNNQKIDLVSVTGNMLEIPRTESGITMFNIKDIAGMKLSTIQTRKKAKDYIDLAYLLQCISLEEMFNIYKQKNKTDNIYNVKCALLDTASVNPYSWQTVKMYKNDIYISNIPNIFKDEVSKYNQKYGIGKKSIFSFFKKHKK